MMDATLQHQLLEAARVEDVFRVGSEVLLTLEAEKYPLKFNTQIAFVNEHRIELNMPDNWWKLIPFEVEMPVRMTALHQGGMFSLSGLIASLLPGRQPGLILTHANKVKRNQRRMFFRVQMEKPFLISKVVFPERECRRNVPATLSDISAGGIGFKSAIFMPQGSRMKSGDLIDAKLYHPFKRPLWLEVVWCRVQRPGGGYRVGAGFIHPSPREQEQMVQVVNQIQRIHLSKYYHIIGEKQAWR